MSALSSSPDAAIAFVPEPSFAHLLALTDERGTWAQADGRVPRRQGGLRTEDAAHLVVASCRTPDPGAAVLEAGRRAFRFLAEAQGVDGAVRSRRTARGHWQGSRAPGHAWGRSMWAFGVAARSASDPSTREEAIERARRGMGTRSRSSRPMALAALGAAEVANVDPHCREARALLSDAVDAIGPRLTDPDWPWPEARLAGCDAVLPDALMAAGVVLDRPEVVADGLALLEWLVDRQTRDGHLSPTPERGSGPLDHGPGFDQPPGTVAALAEACVRAAALTGDRRWQATLTLACTWFAGANDVGAPVWDAASGGCGDVLTASGPSPDQGAAATLALVTTLQCGRLVGAALG